MWNVRTIDEVRQHDTDSHHDLEQARNTATVLLGGALGHVGGSDGGDRTDTDTRDDTTGIDGTETEGRSGGGLECGTDGKEQREGEERVLATNPGGDWCRTEGTEEGAGLENSDDVGRKIRLTLLAARETKLGNEELLCDDSATNTAVDIY